MKEMEKKGSSMNAGAHQTHRPSGRTKGQAMPPTARGANTRHPGAAAFVGLLIVLAVAALIVSNMFFVVKTVAVQGNSFCTWEEILALSGIRPGDSMFSIDTNKVREGINANRYLSYVGLLREFPSHVTVLVEEHAPRAMLPSMGMLVLIGADGFVLEESPDIGMPLQVPTITGAQADRIRVGYPVIYSQAGQGAAAEAILDVLDSFGAASEVSELNVGALDNLYLITEDGLQVMLGSGQGMREKIALMMMLLPMLRENAEVRGGVLDVTSGITGDFRPPRRAQ